MLVNIIIKLVNGMLGRCWSFQTKVSSNDHGRNENTEVLNLALHLLDKLSTHAQIPPFIIYPKCLTEFIHTILIALSYPLFVANFDNLLFLFNFFLIHRLI